MMINGQNPERIAMGNSSSEDRHIEEKYDYLLSNPPFGVDWKKVQQVIEEEHETQGFAGRFGAGLPRISDGSTLFLMHMISKMKPVSEGGSRLAIVFNGSPLFSGDAGSGTSSSTPPAAASRTASPGSRTGWPSCTRTTPASSTRWSSSPTGASSTNSSRTPSTVLQHYTTYKTYWKLLKKTADDPDVPKRETAAQLARFVSLHPHNIAQKTEVMVEHFRSRVRHKIGNRAKAMVVTSSRLAAVRYRLAFQKYLDEKGYKDIGVLVAFSGEVHDDLLRDQTFTEPGMNNGIKERELPEKFASPDFHLLLVANKYQTGFDQPLLHTMYVDERLSDVQAVQTLSRLNRTCRGKEDTFVLDFVNDDEEIRRSFQPYYEQTAVEETADHQKLYELQHRGRRGANVCDEAPLTALTSFDSARFGGYVTKR